MMDKRLYEVLHGHEDNYILPFYWQHGDHYERIPEQVARIAESGCKALCVESRPHNGFCDEPWWKDMDRIIEECEKRDMKVWLLDDRTFPTGFANGLIRDKYPHLRQWVLNERHVDVMGPMDGCTLLAESDNSECITLGVFAYRRIPSDEQMTDEVICLTTNLHGDMLYWDVPQGCWRVFFLKTERKGGHENYIDMLVPESVDVLIEAVYEPHYERYAKYFGNTFAGFFSDEPCFGNQLVRRPRNDRGIYEMRIGLDGLALPYNQRVLAMMSQELGEDALPRLPELWYDNSRAPFTRLAYMNAVTTLYRDNFCRRLGDWCRHHKVEYIGHVIEDMNANSRLGYGTGHYFRAVEGQDMSGIDIVLHQVLPGFAHYVHAAATENVADPAFFHYVLPKLGASLAHLEPKMDGRAMCEVFGAYGWAEGASMMKWLADFLLVRGINHFVPHAFSPCYPDPDCPPHFGAEGHDPQFNGFSALIRYMNKASHLLSGATHIAAAAVLYHAEGEWMSRNSMLTQVPAKVLYDAHLDFDIVSADMLEKAKVVDGKLVLGNESFAVLAVPYAEHLPDATVLRLKSLADAGLPVFYVGGLPNNVQGQTVEPNALAQAARLAGAGDITVQGDFPLLRIYHCMREDKHIFMLFNESTCVTADTVVSVPAEGRFARLRLLEDVCIGDELINGKLKVSLLPGQSEILVFGNDVEIPNNLLAVSKQTFLSPEFTVEIADSDELSVKKPYIVTDRLFNINAPDQLPHFSGNIYYSFDVEFDSIPQKVTMDLGRVGQTARLTVNGKDCGIRICQPYCFDITAALRDGDNRIEVEVGNTLAQKQRDYFSYFLQLPPSGLLGPITLTEFAE